ncbi:BlaI/MecI/CopY family transcriptional regulator [soil metagenome]
MARPSSAHPTDVELEILKVLWAEGPSELGRICATLRKHRPVANTTVATMLKVMRDKGLVDREQGPKGYLWSALVSRRATSAGLLRRLVDRVFDGSAGRLVANLLESDGLSDRDREEIRRLLEAAPSEEPPRGREGEGRVGHDGA